MSQPEAVNWQRVQDLVDSIRANGNSLPDDAKAALKRQLIDKNLKTVLVSLSVLDAVAINCGRQVRAYLASQKWMKRYVQNCLERPFASHATAQLLVNWEHVFKGEELGAAAHATRRQLQAAMGAELPKPNHFAQQMRELIEQQIPLIAFQRGMDFPAAFLPAEHAQQASQPQPAQSARTSSGGWLGLGSIKLPGMQHTAPAPAHSASPPAPLQDQGEQLRQMQGDASALEQCVRSVEALLGGRSSGSAEQELSRGDDAVRRCRWWRGTIRAWVAEEASDRALGELLQMNDRLLALMSQWQAVSDELQAQRPRRGEQPRTPTPLPEPRPDHAQWFSPLGSSATRIMPAGESTPPAPDACSNGSSGSQSHARPGTSPTGNPFGAWPPEQAAPAATIAAAGAARAGSADSASSAGSRGPQQSAAAAALDTAQGSAGSPGIFWSTPAAGDAISDEQLVEAAAASSQGPILQQPHDDMWPMGRKQGVPSGKWGSSPGGLHAIALPGSATPGAKGASPWGQPGQKSALLDVQRKGSGQLPCAHSPPTEQPAAKVQAVLLSQNGGPHSFLEERHGALQSELSALKQQLEDERRSKRGMEHRLQEAARAEQALTAELHALRSKLRGTFPGMEQEKQISGGHGSVGDPGMSYAMTAYSRQPALRVRFSPSHFGAVASSLYNK